MNNMPPRSPFGRHYIQTIHDGLYHAYAPNEDDTLPAILLGGFPTREEAIAKMKWALSEFIVDGVSTNIDFQLALIRCEGFTRGDYDNGYLGRTEINY